MRAYRMRPRPAARPRLRMAEAVELASGVALIALSLGWMVAAGMASAVPMP